MAALVVQVDHLAPRRTMKRLEEAIGAPLILNLVGARLLEYVDESFRTAGRGKWKPLSWSTLALRFRGGDKPLQDTGRYKQSFVQETDDATFVEVGSNIKTDKGRPLAPIHEQGTGPYVIRIRNAKILAAKIGTGAGGAGFRNRSVGLIRSQRTTRWFFFGKEVQHPGVPARPVLPQTGAEVEVILKPMLEAALEKAKGDDN